MLNEIMRTPLETSVLGARFHAVLAGGSRQAVAACLLRDSWTCHRCGIRLPGFMEVDHLSDHAPCSAGHLRTICQFCHNLRHAFWAAGRGRLRIIRAPALDQSAVTRIAWFVLLASEGTDGQPPDHDLAAAAHLIVNDAKRRERVLGDVLGTAHAAGLFEALFALKRLAGADAYWQSVDRLDSYVRFWPAAANRSGEKPGRACAAFSQWRDGDFHDMSAELVSAYWRSEASVEHLREICSRHDPAAFLRSEQWPGSG